MRAFVPGLLAVLAVCITPVAAQRLRGSSVDPRTYSSPSGEYALFVDPSSRDGSGPASYRLSREGVEVWTTTHPFTWASAFVCDDGASAGYGYTLGVDGGSYEKPGSFEVVVLDPKGVVRERHTTARTESSYLHEPANPIAFGLIPSCDRDRFVVRVADDDVNRQSESWWPFRISTGEALTPFKPKDGQTNTDSLRYVLAAVHVRETPLTLIQWFQYGPFEPGGATRDGTRFALIDEQGASVWTLDLPDDYTKADGDESDTFRDELHAHEHGMIARWDEPRRFDLDLAHEAQRVKFEVTPETSGSWSVREVGRSAVEAKATTVDELPVEAAPAPMPLALAGVVDLETCKTPAPFVRKVNAFAFDGTGNVAFLHWEHEPYRVEIGYADARGARIAEHVLPDSDGEGGKYESELVWLGDDRFLIGWSAYSSHPSAGGARVSAVSTRTGERKLLVDDVGYELKGLAGLGDGRFLVLGDNRLDAFDASGERLWNLTSADGLCGADHVAVLSDCRIVVSDRSGIQWIGASGKVGRHDQLEKLWGRSPRYLRGLQAGLDGGLIVQDFDRNVCMNASGKPIGDSAPRFPDGRAVEVAESLRAGPGKRLWTSDGYAILGLDARGQVEVVLGEGPEAGRLTEAAAVALGPDDRIHAAAERTGDVHVIDVDKGLVRVLRPAPADFTRNLSFASASLTVDDDGDTYLGSGEEGDRPLSSMSFVHWSSGGERKGVERAGLDTISEAWIAQAGTKNRWVLGHGGNWLVGRDGKVLAKVERKPDGQWLNSDRAFGAPDGSIAFIAGRSASTAENPLEAVVYAADGSARAQVPLLTSNGSLHAIAYDGARVVLIADKRLHVHDVASGSTSIHALPGIEGAKTDLWTPFLPRKHDEVWVFDGHRTLRRYALPRR